MRGPQHVAGGAEMDAVGPVLQYRHAVGDHAVEQAGKKPFELLGAARHQQVHMFALGHRGAVRRAVRHVVALVDGHAFAHVRQHPGRT